MKVILVLCLLVGVGMAAPPRSLGEDFLELLELIPVEELKDIVCKYKDDEEVQYVINYLRGEEWAELVGEVGNNPTWIGFKDYLNEAGINVDLIIAIIHSIIQEGFCEDINAVSNRSFRELLDELLAALPREEIREWYYDKLENSCYFQVFYRKISSDRARELVEEVLALEEVQKILAKLAEFGVDLQKIKDFIWNLLGWE